MPAKKKPFTIIHHFPGGTKKQYAASIAALHPSKNGLPKGQMFHAAGPTVGGWTVVAVHDSKKSWVKFRDEILIPSFKKGIKGGFKTPPEEISMVVENLQA